MNNKLISSDHMISTYVPKVYNQRKIVKVAFGIIYRNCIKTTEGKITVVIRSQTILASVIHLLRILASKDQDPNRTVKAKNVSPEKAYQLRKRDILKRLHEQPYPDQMKGPTMLKSFYWSPDYSF